MARLGEFKVHTCCICHKLVDGKPHRLVHQEWTNKHRYQNKHNFDLCDTCWVIFERWIKKHNVRRVKER